jgi:NTP pyrophosphatase (non-canonical NTP hydrolase)
MSSNKERAMDLLRSIEIMRERQINFQRLAGVKIDSDELEDKLELSEVYILKIIEEAVELRKTLPSHFNKFENNPAQIDRGRMVHELVDMLMFTINYCLVWDITAEELLKAIPMIQVTNFNRLATKVLKRGLDDGVLKPAGSCNQ